MRQYVVAIALTTLFAATSAAQAPAGWQVRIDQSTSASDPDDVKDIKVATVGKGFRVTGGPAGTFWSPATRAKGNFTATATFNLMKPSDHTNYYGLVFGGEDLGGANQRYIYFLVAQNGTYTIRQCQGEAVQDVPANVRAQGRALGGGRPRSSFSSSQRRSSRRASANEGPPFNIPNPSAMGSSEAGTIATTPP